MENEATSLIQKPSAEQLVHTDKLEKRKQQAINWLKQPNNLILTLIMIFAFAIRLYYFSLTQGQPLWWDASEYMNMARAWAFGLEYEFLPVRPVLLSLITAIFLKIYPSEFLPRAMILLLSMASVVGMYLLGKEIYNEKAGLISSFLMSVFYLNLFYTYRLLVEIPSMTFFIFSALFFYRYFITNSKKSLYLGAVMIAIGTLFKINTAAFLFIIMIYVLITEKLNFIKKKEYWISAVIFLLILSPYLIWGYFQFHGFVITQAGAWNAPEEGEFWKNGFENLETYRSMFLSFLSWPLLIIFILGLLSMYKLIMGLDMLIKGKNIELNRDLFLILIFITPIIIASISIAFVEDRYIFVSFPAIFIISANFILKISNRIEQKKKFLVVLFILILLGSVAYFQLQYADSLIKIKKESYMGLKQGGLWLKDNSEPPEIILTRSPHQIRYYSERETINIPSKREEFDELLTSKQNIKYLLVSIFEDHEPWIYSYPQENNLTVIHALFADPERQQPILVVYKFN